MKKKINYKNKNYFLDKTTKIWIKQIIIIIIMIILLIIIIIIMFKIE